MRGRQEGQSYRSKDGKEVERKENLTSLSWEAEEGTNTEGCRRPLGPGKVRGMDSSPIAFKKEPALAENLDLSPVKLVPDL